MRPRVARRARTGVLRPASCISTISPLASRQLVVLLFADVFQTQASPLPSDRAVILLSPRAITCNRVEARRRGRRAPTAIRRSVTRPGHSAGSAPGCNEARMTRQKAGAPTFADLPPAARAYVGAVVASGALCLLDAATQAAVRSCARAVRVAAGARHRDLGGQDRSAARPQPIESVAVPRDQLLGAVRAGTGARGLHRDASARGRSARSASAPATRCIAILFNIGSLTLTAWLAGVPVAS